MPPIEGGKAAPNAGEKSISGGAPQIHAITGHEGRRSAGSISHLPYYSSDSEADYDHSAMDTSPA